MPTPLLNWKEIALLASSFRPKIEGLFVERIVVPENAHFPGGYLKGEWAIRLTGRRSEGVFIFSVRTQHPYFYFIDGKGPKASTQGTRSAFDLELSKHLKGQKIIRFETLPRERTLVLWMTDFALVINLIPAAPEALLVTKNGAEIRIITRSRIGKSEPGALYTFPDGSKAPESPPVRPELLKDFPKLIAQELAREAFELRQTFALRELRSAAKQAQDRLRSTEVALQEAEGDLDWKKFGDLLKATLHEPPRLQDITKELKKKFKGATHFRALQDYTDDQPFLIPSDPKLSPSEQVEKFYQLARRRSRKISESRTRVADLKAAHERLNELIELPIKSGDWKGLEKLERAANPLHTGQTLEDSAARNKKAGAWLGKTFTSRDGLSILVGKSKDENLELTFKHSRGNDIWMHIRGKPGAHVLIPLQTGKSAPLETLLDAAVLCVYYSGGEKWGKTEVDYTFKKYVKRIKDSSEASYTHNKTLIVEPEAARLKRLIKSP